MKVFNAPVIIDVMDSPEGIYLASGSTPGGHIDPPKPDPWEKKVYWSNHDTGSYSVLSIYLKNVGGKGGDGLSVTVKYKGLYDLINVKPNSAGCGMSWAPWNHGNCFYAATAGHYNPGENIHLKLDMYFKHDSRYPADKQAYVPEGSGDQELNEFTGNASDIFDIEVL